MFVVRMILEIVNLLIVILFLVRNEFYKVLNYFLSKWLFYWKVIEEKKKRRNK